MGALDLRLGLAVSNEVPLAQTVDLARTAERLGLAEVWLPESRHGRSATTAAAVVIGVTERIGVGIGVVNPFWRHPSLLAMEAATLDEASGGRLRFGLGAGLWTLHALGEADERTDHPLVAMSEALHVVRAMLRGTAGVDGVVFPVRQDAHLDFVPVRRDLPVYVGAVNARMIRTSAALADGVYLGAITSPGYTRWAVEQVADGARAAGRDPGEVDLTANVLVSVDDDARAARDAVRRVLAYYLHRVEGVVVSTSGADQAAVDRVRAAVRDDGLDAGAAQVTDELIDTFAAAGDPAHVAARLRTYGGAGLRGILAWHVLGPDPVRGLAQLAEEVWPQVRPTSSGTAVSTPTLVPSATGATR